MPNLTNFAKQVVDPDWGEFLSALADGQLEKEDYTVISRACEQGEGTTERWGTYHLIGDVLRSPGALLQTADASFIKRLNARLAEEPVKQVKQVKPDDGFAPGLFTVMPPALPGAVIPRHGPAANDGSFRWKLLAGVASLAAVSAIAWNTAGFLSPHELPQLAQANTNQQIVVASPQGPIVRDARLEELIAAHRQLGGGSVLEVPSGFLRNATYETPQNVGR